MAKYQIAAVNYIASGDQRTLLNIDTQLVYHNVRNVYILDSENTALCNIVTEEGDIQYLPTEYIDKEHPLDRRRMRLSGEYKLSSEPLSEEELSNTITILSGDISSLSDDLYQLSNAFLSNDALTGFIPVISSHILEISNSLSNAQPIDRIIDLSNGIFIGIQFFQLSNYTVNICHVTSPIILNEQQKYGYDRHANKNKRIMLYLSSNAEDIEERLQRFNDNIYHENMTFVAEAEQSTIDDLKVPITGLDRWIRPIYDIKDVSIKSCVLKDTLNSNLYQTDEFVDIYAPMLSSYPVEFCQCQEDAYIVTDAVSDNPTMLYSSLNFDRLNYDMQRDFYYMMLSSGEIGEYLYISKDDAGVSSYVQLSSSQLFIPVSVMLGIGHNYIIQMNMQQYRSQYEKGDVYAQQIDLAKNMYDCLYSMNMPERTAIRECRQYCGVNSSNGSVYLKFYDNSNYSQVSSRVDPGTGINELRMGRDGQSKFPFQKIEMYLPNSFKIASTHKSNLFSVKIKKKGIERLLTEEAKDLDEDKKLTMRQLYQVLKRDIKNACKQIAERAAPANTQFFDVFFEQ